MLKKVAFTTLAVVAIAGITYLVIRTAVPTGQKPVVRPASPESAATLPSTAKGPKLEESKAPTTAGKPAIKAVGPRAVTEPKAEAKAAEAAGALETQAIVTGLQGEARGLEGKLVLGHLSSIDSGERGFSEVLAEAGYRFNARNKVGVSQVIRKLYEVAEFAGEQEYPIDDTQVFYERVMSENAHTLRTTLNAGATIPDSRLSRDNKHVTRPWIEVELKRALFADRVSVSLTPTAQYYFNSWGTNAKGIPLRRMAVGSGAEIRWWVAPKLISLGAWAKGYYHFYEEYDTSASTPTPTTDFALGSYLDLEVLKQVAVQLGVARGNTFLPDVRYETRFYDPIATRAYVALQIAL